MDLSKLSNLPNQEKVVLDVASGLVNKKNSFTITQHCCNNKASVDENFNTVFRAHQEVIEMLESSGFAVINGSEKVLRGTLDAAQKSALDMDTKFHEHRVIFLYEAGWNPSNDRKFSTVLANYHVLIACWLRESDEKLVNLMTYTSGTIALTQGITVGDPLVQAFIDSHETETESDDSEEDGDDK